MLEGVRKSVVRTLIYSDIFDYPLTKGEIWRFLIAEKTKRTPFEKSLTEFPPGRWELKDGLFFLLGRGEIVKTRRKRQEISKKKLELVEKIIRFLSFVPTVLFIGISGGLSLKNSQEEDDIDLFIISSRGNLWFTRLILITMLILVGQYRGRGKKKSQKICLNMFLDEDGLMLPKERQDLYTAHEIAQVMPVFERNNTYIKFLDANKWVLKFLPNALDRVRNKELGVKNKKSDRLFIIYYLLFILEHMAKAIQLLSINQHKTIETISDDLLAFHPFDYRSYVLKEYNKRLKHYGL